MSGNLLFSVAGERAVKSTGTNINWGLYLNDTGFGLYDWQNTRSLLGYDKTANTLGLGNSGTGFAINGSTIGITGATSLTTTSPLTTINASTSVTITTPTINLNGSTAVNINSNRILTIADKDVANGIPQLDVNGNCVVKGNAIFLTRDGSNHLFIGERTGAGGGTPEGGLMLTREGPNIYSGYLQLTAGTYSSIVCFAHRDVAWGVAGLSSDGSIIAPGSDLTLARTTGTDLRFWERTSGDCMFFFRRNASNNYNAYINKGSGTTQSWTGVVDWKDRDVAYGFAALGTDGNLFAPGGYLWLARNSSNNIHLSERTSQRDMVYFHYNEYQAGYVDVTGYLWVSSAGGWKRIATVA
jgi:hypothetical protein